MTSLAPNLTQPDVPETARAQFAFLMHPRNEVAADMGTIHPLLALIPSRFWEYVFEKFPVKPRIQSRVFAADSDEMLGQCIVVPLSPRQLLGRNRKLVDRRIQEAVEFARAQGATLIGLGSLTATVTSGGKKLSSRTDVGVTNGNAFTAAATVSATVKVIEGLGFPAHVALVGATGSVGSAVAKVLGERGVAGKLTLIGRAKGKLGALEAAITNTPVATSTSIDDCIEADVVVLMTSATESLLKSEHLKHGAIVIDDTQPRNTDESLVTERPDVKIIDGGLILTNGLERRGSGKLPLPQDVSFACLAETALLALTGHSGHGVIGDPTLDQVYTMERLALDHKDFGFVLAAPTSFGNPIEVAGWNA